MKRSILFVALSAVAVGVMGSAARVAVSSGQSGALVRLQTGFPGVVQSGNINVSGYIRGSQLNMSGSGPKFYGITTDSNAVVGVSQSTANFPAIFGQATNAGNYGVGAQNSAIGSGALLGGTYGLETWAGSGTLAGKFDGNVNVNGNIGVNTGTPAFPVSVQSSNPGYYLGLGNGGVTKWVVSSWPDGNGLDIAEENVAWARMHFSPGGKVGINNQAPAHALDVRGAIVSDSFIRVNATGYGFLQEISGKGVGCYLDANAGFVGTLGNTPLYLFAGGSPHSILTTDGKVGLGTFNPSSKLEVSSTGSITTLAAYGTGTDGIFATTTGTNGNAINAIAHNGSSARGVWGKATSGYGVLGQGPVYGVYAGGNLGASGTKTFRIDHPQDPLNKYLLHYSAEGPEPRNVYQGSVTTGPDGYVWVQLPDYYSEINSDPLIQLTVVDESDDFVQVKVSKRLSGNQFQIRTSRGQVEVNWRVDAIRNDAFVQKYGAPVEVNKTEPEKGKYQHPELYGAPAEMGMYYSPVEGTKAAQRKEPAALPPIK